MEQKKMPHKNTSNLSTLIDFLKNSQSFQCVLMAMIIAFLRVIYYGERKFIKIGMEILFCGFISLGASGAIDFIEAVFRVEFPDSVLITAYSMIGFIGVAALREVLIKFLNKKADQPTRPSYDDEDNYL